MADIGSYEWAMKELTQNGENYRSVEQFRWLANTVFAEVPGADASSTYLFRV